MSMIAQSQIGWDELSRQFPILTAALLVAWYAFRHITRQHDDHLKDMRNQYEQTLKILGDAHLRLDAAKDIRLVELKEQLAVERREKDRLLKVIESIGGTP